MPINMTKLGFLPIVIIFLLYVIDSFANVQPITIGNEEFPNVEIPAKLMVPKDNAFKFHLLAAGYFWYKCNGSHAWELDDDRVILFNKKEDVAHYPFTGVASSFKSQNGLTGLRSLIPHDPSSLVFSAIAVAPPKNPEQDAPLQLSEAQLNYAFSKITYVIRVATHGGAPPANSL
ncbi:13454_t:CDS:2, partial [Racocetra persica]